jgi:hypothetical protein
MPPVGFEPTVSAGEWPQTYILDGAVTRTGNLHLSPTNSLNNQACLCIQRYNLHYSPNQCASSEVIICIMRGTHVEPVDTQVLSGDKVGNALYRVDIVEGMTNSPNLRNKSNIDEKNGSTCIYRYYACSF